MHTTSDRSGHFWDAMEGRRPLPRAAATLGLEFVSWDPEHATLELAFSATDDFTNPFGNVLGAFLAAMLYDTVGPTLLATLAPDQFQSTVSMNVTFLHPAKPGRIAARGRIVERRDGVAIVEAMLFGPDGVTLATATATALQIAIGEAAAAV